MEFVLMIIAIIVISIVTIMYPQKDTFIEKLTLKGTYKSFELEIRAKQKNDPPTKKDRSHLE
ncbi:MAG: hypothetical protein ACRDDX_11350 [Cellulosilyticaceae bacterium]